MNTSVAPGTALRYCGRDFTPEELELVRSICTAPEFPHRSAISREVCRRLDWRKPDGGLKQGSCRVVLLRMEADGLITLPPARRRPPSRPPTHTPAGEPQPPLYGSRGALGAIELRQVGGTPESALWNELVDRYHYVGYKRLPGAQIRYIAYAGPRILATLGFSASAWRLYDRDEYIGWDDEQRQANLHLVVNLSRFLILPWVHIKFLASSLLAQATRQLPHDWSLRYNYTPLLLESFVECDRFAATCFRAANWTFVGETMGRGKLDRRNSGPTTTFKSIWCYPLHRRFRQRLRTPPARPAPGGWR